MSTTNHRLDLKLSNKIWMDIPEGVNAISIWSHNGVGWDSGAITVKKANAKDLGSPVDINSTPVTISGNGLKELAFADFAKAAFLCLDVTTPATSTNTIVDIAICMKRFAFLVT